MERAASKKYHFAPLRRQAIAIERFVDAHRFKNMTEFMRKAIDHYLDNLGRPPLSVQARQMADAWEFERKSRRSPDALQAPSMHSDEKW